MLASDNAELRLHDWYQLLQKAGVYLVATWRVPDVVSADMKDKACSAPNTPLPAAGGNSEMLKRTVVGRRASDRTIPELRVPLWPRLALGRPGALEVVTPRVGSRICWRQG